MNLDVISIIEKFAHIDLIKYKYKCEECNNNIDNIGCCIYSNEENFTSVFNEEIDFFTKIITYNFKYICNECFDKNDSIFFYFKYLLDFESLEKLFIQILETEKNKFKKKIIYSNIIIEENNHNNYFKLLYSIYNNKNNQIITHNFIYENEIPFYKYFINLPQKEQLIFKDFKIK